MCNASQGRANCREYPQKNEKLHGFGNLVDKSIRMLQNSAKIRLNSKKWQRTVEMSEILLINGPNLNLLGTREPERYGSESLASINERLVAEAERAGVTLRCVQSNAEPALIDLIHQAPDAGTQFIIINPAAFTHTSIALRDALLAVAIPFIEVHLSNVHAREAFRQHSYFSDIAQGVICGLGSFGYDCALAGALKTLAQQHES